MTGAEAATSFVMRGLDPRIHVVQTSQLAELPVDVEQTLLEGRPAQSPALIVERRFDWLATLLKFRHRLVRLALKCEADLILVFSRGHFVKRGSFSELIARGITLAHLVRIPPGQPAGCAGAE